MTTAGPSLKAIDLVAGYGPGRPVLQGVNLTVERGRITVLLGPNGAGKSTLLKVIAGFLSPRRGRVLLGEVDIGSLAPHRRIEQGVALLSQGRSTFQDLTVLENIELGGWTMRSDRKRLRQVSRRSQQSRSTRSCSRLKRRVELSSWSIRTCGRPSTSRTTSTFSSLERTTCRGSGAPSWATSARWCADGSACDHARPDPEYPGKRNSVGPHLRHCRIGSQPRLGHPGHRQRSPQRLHYVGLVLRLRAVPPPGGRSDRLVLSGVTPFLGHRGDGLPDADRARRADRPEARPGGDVRADGPDRESWHDRLDCRYPRDHRELCQLV